MSSLGRGDSAIRQSNRQQAKILPLNEIKSEITRFTNDMLKREITGKELGNAFCQYGSGGGGDNKACSTAQTREIKTKINNLPVFLIVGHSSYDINAEMDDVASVGKKLTIKRPGTYEQAYFQLPYDEDIAKNKFVVYTTAAGAWGMLDTECNEGPGHILNNTNRKIKSSLFSASGNTSTRILIGTQRDYGKDFSRFEKGEHTASYYIPGSRTLEKGHQLSDQLLSGGGFGIIRLNSTLASEGQGATTGTTLLNKWADSPDVAKSWRGFEEDTDFVIEEIIALLKKINKKEGGLRMPDLNIASERPLYKFLHKYQNNDKVKEAFNNAFDEAADEAAAAVEEAFQRSAEASLGGKKELEKAEKEEMKAKERAKVWEAWRGHGDQFFEEFESSEEEDIILDCKVETEKERVKNLYYLTSDGKLTKKDKALRSLMFKKAKACNQLWMSEIIQTGDPGIYISLACSSIYAFLRLVSGPERSGDFVSLEIGQGADEAGTFYQFYDHITKTINGKIVPANNKQWDDMTKQLGYEQRTTPQEEKAGTMADINVYKADDQDQATDSARITHSIGTRGRTRKASKAAREGKFVETIQQLDRKRRGRSPKRYSPSANKGGGRNRRTRKKLKRKTKRKRKYIKSNSTRKKRGGKKSNKVKKYIKIFQQYPKVFPSGYFRFLGARLQNHIDNKTLIYKNGVILTWIKYQKTVKKSKKCIIKPGDVKLDQIVNKNQGNGAAKQILLEFLKKHEKNRIWLEVRNNNKRAIRLYKKNGFKKVCNIKFGEISGIIMVKN